MTVSIGSGLGAPGTRVTKRLGLDDEVLAYIYQAIVGSVAGNFILTLILITFLVLGWWALSIWLSVIGFLVGTIVLLYVQPRSLIWHLVLGNLWGIGFIAPFIPAVENGQIIGTMGQVWYRAITAGLSLIVSQIAVIGELDWWWYVGAGGALFLLWIKVGLKGWKTVLVIALLLSLAGIIAFSDGGEWMKAAQTLKYLIVPYCIMPMVYSGLLMAAMIKEILFPSLEWTLNPVSFEELRETGLRGLWFPGLFSKSQENDEPEQEPTVRAEHRDDSGNGVKERYGILPFSNRARDFYKALAVGRPFTLSTARLCKVGRRTFEGKIWPVFRDRGWARWKDDLHHDQGRRITRAGWEMIEELVKSDPRH